MAGTTVTTHSYRTPFLGAYDYHNRHMTQNDTITKTSFGPLPYQKEIATPTDSRAVEGTLKLDRNPLNNISSVTQKEYSAPGDKIPSTINYCPNAKRISSISKTPKELARDYRYISTVFAHPDPRAGASDYSIHRTGYQPYTEEYKKCMYRPNLQESSLWSNAGFDAKTEFLYNFTRPHRDDYANQALPTARYEPKSLYDCSPIGPAKLNVTHNIITGDRFNIHDHKVGRSCTRDTYCAHPLVNQHSNRRQYHQRNISSSIPQGDPEKVLQDTSYTHASYQDPLPDSKDLRFNSLSDITMKTSLILHENNKLDPSAYITQSRRDYQRQEGKPSTRSKCWWLNKIDSIPKGDLDPVRAGDRVQHTTAKSHFVEHPSTAYAHPVSAVGHVTDSNIKIGCPTTHLPCGISLNSSAYQPYSKQSREHIVPPPKDLLNIKFHDDDYVQSSNMTESFKPHTGPSSVQTSLETTKVKNGLDYKSRWSLPTMGPPSYTTTHKAHYSNPMSLLL